MSDEEDRDPFDPANAIRIPVSELIHWDDDPACIECGQAPGKGRLHICAECWQGLYSDPLTPLERDSELYEDYD